jgi:hypothetical protein
MACSLVQPLDTHNQVSFVGENEYQSTNNDNQKFSIKRPAAPGPRLINLA